MKTIATASRGFMTVPLDGYDQATDALDKAEAILSTLSVSYDDEYGFMQSEHIVWMTLLAARDLVDAARSSLTKPSPSAA